MKSIAQGFSPRKILLCQLNQIGDVLLLTPSVELLAKRYPSAAIHVVTEKKCVPVLENNPLISRIWPIDKKQLTSLPKELAYYRRIAAQGFDLVVDFQQTPRIRWIVGFSRAAVRLTRTPHWYMRWLYTHWVEPDDVDEYAAAIKSSILRPLGIRWQGERPRLYLTEAERSWADDYLSQAGIEPNLRLVTVDSTHRRSTRCWPAASYAALIDRVAETMPETRFLLLYGPGEREVIDDLAKQVRHQENLLIPDRVLTLREAAACIARADLHVGNCSAPRHMAVAVDTPTVTVLGATSNGWTYPAPEHRYLSLGLPCQPCNRNECPNPRCLTEMDPERVAQAVLTALREAG